MVHIIKINDNNIPSSMFVAADTVEAAELLADMYSVGDETDEEMYQLSESMLNGFESETKTWHDDNGNSFICVEFELNCAETNLI